MTTRKYLESLIVMNNDAIDNLLMILSRLNYDDINEISDAEMKISFYEQDNKQLLHQIALGEGN